MQFKKIAKIMVNISLEISFHTLSFRDTCKTKLTVTMII